MPDEPLNTDPVARLARFTPAVTGIDRDELLFRAGRASARVSWKWPVAAVLLVATNAVTLALWLSAPRPAAVAVADPPVAEPAPRAEPPAPASPEPPGADWVARARLTGELPPPRTMEGPFTPPADPLTVLSARADPYEL
jgi:hypothetical protein